MSSSKKQASFAKIFISIFAFGLAFAVDYVILSQGQHFIIAAEQTVLDDQSAQQLIASKLDQLQTWLDEVYEKLYNLFQIDAASNCPNGKFEYVLTDQEGVAFSVRCLIGGDYRFLQDDYSMHLFPLHETINSFTSYVTEGWPSIHRVECSNNPYQLFCKAEWWVDTAWGSYSSPFPDITDEVVLSYDEALKHFQTTFKTPYHYVFATLYREYGANIFAKMFNLMKQKGVDLNNYDFFEASKRIVYFLMAAANADLRKIFLVAGIPVPSDEDVAKYDQEYGLNVKSVLQPLNSFTVIWYYPTYLPSHDVWTAKEIVIYYKTGSTTTISNPLTLKVPFVQGDYYSPPYAALINMYIPAEEIEKIAIIHDGTGYQDPTVIISYSSTDGKLEYYYSSQHTAMFIHGKVADVPANFQEVYEIVLGNSNTTTNTSTLSVTVDSTVTETNPTSTVTTSTSTATSVSTATAAETVTTSSSETTAITTNVASSTTTVDVTELENKIKELEEEIDELKQEVEELKQLKQEVLDLKEIIRKIVESLQLLTNWLQ